MPDYEEEQRQLALDEESIDFSPTDIDSFTLGAPDFRDQEGLRYPALLLSNVLFMDCLKILSTLKRPSFRSVDVWIRLENDEGYEHIGEIQLDSEILLILRYLHVTVTIYYTRDEVETLDLDSPRVLECFI